MSIYKTCMYFINTEEKRKLNHHARGESSWSAPSATSGTQNSSKHGESVVISKMQYGRQYPKLAPSTVLSKLATLNRRPADVEPRGRVTRSSGFAESPPNAVTNDNYVGGVSTPKRDESLAVIEDLEPGPTEHTPPSDDPEFQQLEPNSGIRLR
jgi:minichromosome maintenance protein 10